MSDEMLLEDNPAHYWEVMFKKLVRENSRLMERCGELEDLLRWRDVNVEPLPKEGSFLIVEKNRHFPQGVLMEFHWVWPFNPPSKNTTHWMPMLKLPKGE